MEAIAAEAAAGISGEQHATIQSAADATGATFIGLRKHLRTVRDRHQLRSPLYTLRRAGDGTAFVVMTNPSPYIGDRYELRSEMRAVFEGGERARTGLYHSATGAYVSGFAPIRRANQVVALVSADRPSADLVVQQHRGWMLAGVAALLLGLLGGWLPEVLRDSSGGLATAVQRVFDGSLAMRIGLAGTASVVLAVGVVAALDYREAKRDLVERLGQQLRTAVSVGAPRIDAAAHQRVAASGDGESADFLALRDVLRELQEAAQLKTPVYTFRRDGELARFVVMTNETPFIGDANELRPALKATFDSGSAGTEGPYSNATGTWISAFAPVRDGSAVVAVLQADYEVGTLLDALANHALRSLLFALAGIGVAFLFAFGLARGIARPIRQVADAAAKIRTGDFSVQVPEERIDEVGELSKAINRMARGLHEREQLRTMFGRYMAGQVVSELLATGEVSLEGELREVTVIISDIRGYTALTESLGAKDVVALLNEYFAILVEEVVARDGVIDKFMGDAMLCWFGAPVPQPDHAERAVAACTAIMNRLHTWNIERERAGLGRVRTGVGVANGDVIVGNIGSQQRLEYTAIGDAVNLASRLCSHAESGEVVVTDGVRKASPDAPWHDIGPITVKGVKEPVLVHKLTFE